MEVVKKVFPQEDDKPHDGENVVRNDEVKNEKADMDPKGMTHLCTYGRDEEYIMNKFWQEGVQTVFVGGRRWNDPLVLPAAAHPNHVHLRQGTSQEDHRGVPVGQDQ